MNTNTKRFAQLVSIELLSILSIPEMESIVLNKLSPNDYCDFNQIMLDVYEQMFGRECNVEDNDIDLFNEVIDFLVKHQYGMFEKTVEAKNLKVGDVIRNTYDEVIVAPTRGLKTPKGKVELIVTTPKGHRVLKTWNANNKIVIL